MFSTKPVIQSNTQQFSLCRATGCHKSFSARFHTPRVGSFRRCCGSKSVGAPIGSRTIIVMDLEFAATIAPVEISAGRMGRRAGDFLVAEIDPVGFERRIVRQAVPRDRSVLLTHA